MTTVKDEVELGAAQYRHPAFLLGRQAFRDEDRYVVVDFDGERSMPPQVDGYRWSHRPSMFGMAVMRYIGTADEILAQIALEPKPLFSWDGKRMVELSWTAYRQLTAEALSSAGHICTLVAVIDEIRLETIATQALGSGFAAFDAHRDARFSGGDYTIVRLGDRAKARVMRWSYLMERCVGLAKAGRPDFMPCNDSSAALDLLFRFHDFQAAARNIQVQAHLFEYQASRLKGRQLAA